MVLENLEQIKTFINEAETKKEEKVLGICIKSIFGNVIFQSTKSTYKEAIIEKGDANLRGANLRGADLSGTDLRDADLRGAELQNVKFYGRGGTKPLKRSQIPDFLSALGFVIED